MHLILFDIEGTLIDSGGAGTRSLNLAFKELYSIEDAFHDIAMAGKTDILIMKEGLIKHGISPNGNLDAVIKSYLRHLQNEIHNYRRHVKPGVHELLNTLSAIKHIKLGLLTGNLESGARIKLEPFKLNRYFPTGAFGSDDEDRNRLSPIAVKRFEELCQTSINTGNCIMIGDTPRDIHCAKIYGAICIGVATGPYSFNSLKEAGANVVVEDLLDHHNLLQILK